MGNFIVGAMIIMILGIAIFNTVKQSKKGGCAGCSGGCTSKSNCHK